MLPGLSIGGWISSNLALAGRVSNLWYVPDHPEIINGYLGAELGYAPSTRWYLAAGLGLQLLDEVANPEFGVGSDLRAAYLPFQSHPSALGFTAELIAGVVDGGFTYSVGGGLIWQL